MGRPGDLLIALSGSGRSKNIIEALDVAAEMNMDSYLVTDYLRINDMQQSEEAQLVMGHAIMLALRK